MERLSTAVTVFGLVLAFAWVSGCEGNIIALGDGRKATGGASSAGGDASSDSGTGGSDDGGNCQHGQIKANDVVWIGDSWVVIPGTQHTRVRDLARAEGAIGPNDDYVILAASATTIATIASQYDTQEAGPTKVKILIMNGGGWDLIAANGSAASVSSVGQTFKQHLAKVATDGTVQHVIYYLYPEVPTTPGVAALRPVMQQACAQSTVPCHFLDLQPLWAGHPEYTATDGVQASEAGATVIGDAIWAIMQQNCIAQ
jgi:hypothetical protein